MSRTHSARRSLLFMPADSRRKIEKAVTLNADSIVLDLEDSVALSQKADARTAAREALQSLDFGRREKLVRVNALQTGLFHDDIRETIAGRPDGYVIPKVQSAKDLRTAMDFIAGSGAMLEWRAEAPAVLAILETGSGVLNAREIAALGRPLEALIFGADDFAADIGAERSKSNTEVLYARSAVVLAAAAHGLQSIDIVFFDLKDAAGLDAECLAGRQLGYTGKMLIHPDQVEITNRAFSPSPAQIDWAQRVLDAHAEHQARGAGAFALDGRMVDAPIVKQAERVIARAQLARRGAS
jgi:citrate lyase beta subunit